MEEITQDKLIELAKTSIRDCIFEASAATGKFLQGIWLFKVPDDLKDPILGSGIEIHPDKAKLRFSVAEAKKRIAQIHPDFSIIACSAVAGGSEEEARARHAKIVETNKKPAEGMAYSFYVQRPGIEPVMLCQYYKAVHGTVELVGDIKIVHDFAFLPLADLDFWSEMTPEEEQLTSKGEMLEINPKILTDSEITMRNMFPKELSI